MKEVVNDKVFDYIRNSISASETILGNMIKDGRGRPYPSRYAFLSIKKNLDDFINGKGESRWVVMPGLRGTGKTTILAQIYFYLKNKSIPPERILFLKTDDIVGLLKSNLYEAVINYEKLINERFEELTRNIYLLVDETHFDDNWAQTLKSIYDKSSRVFILTTGSSAMAFRRNADISRRTIIERVYPLRFIEYGTLKNRQFPEPGLANEIANSLFSSKDAQEVYNRLQKLSPSILRYWAKNKISEIEKYLANGSLPYLYNLNPEDAYTRVLEMLNTVVYKDINFLGSFDGSTLKTFPKLLLSLAICEGPISKESLSKTLGVSYPTLDEMLQTLEQTEIIDAIPSYGSAMKKINKPPRYVFYSPILKASLLWSIGRFSFNPVGFGKLFEDVAALYFTRAQKSRTPLVADIGRLWGEGQADYLVSTPDLKKIIFELSWGRKDTKQVRTSMDMVKSKYGLIVAETELKLEDNIVFVPKSTFLLM